MNRDSFLRCVLVFALASLLGFDAAAQNKPATDANAVVISRVEGTVEVAPAGTDNWAPAKRGQVMRVGDKLRTGKLSRATLSSPKTGDMPVRESSLLTINAPRAGSDRPVVELVKGFFYFFNRGQPTEVDFRNRLAAAAVRGTEFHVWIDDDGRIELTVLDGEVGLTNAQGGVDLLTGDQGVAAPGLQPTKTSVINAVNIIQWCLYYPGVVEVDELPLNDAERGALAESLRAYRAGDLPAALTSYPAGRVPASDAEKIYRAALMLTAGEVTQANDLLQTLGGASPFANALRKLVAAVKYETFSGPAPATASEWVAESYFQQSRSKLEPALAAAREAVRIAPNFGFAWARVAEMEFSFGHIEEAQAAIERALKLSPRHAEALALRGFLLAAQNRLGDALRSFEAAMETDAGLGDAWLGRGLVRIRRGDLAGGRDDLRTAAALEPNRAVLRSYLGKAFSDAGDNRHATAEFAISRRLDPNDPTSWLYAALHDQQRNRINEAIRELERSKELNNNRSVYRSEQLLDQDLSVRSANLAGVYQDAGMTDVAVWEAARAVNADYANYSAHLFLANSYDALRDPKQINLRYETPAISEYLIASLLAPVGAGPLSQTISPQEYGRFFQRDRLGLASFTEYQSGGNWYEAGAQFGTLGNMSYAVEGIYRGDNGERPNNDIEYRQLGIQLKQQITMRDTLYAQVIDYRARAGDVAQYFNQRSANTKVRTHEVQDPLVLAGYHHEWAPGVHTLLLGSRIADTYSVQDPMQRLLLIGRNADGQINGVAPTTLNQHYSSELTIYSAELQQILQTHNHTTVVGARYQNGELNTDVNQNQFVNPLFFPADFNSRQSVSADFERISVYGYHTWRVVEPLQLIAGVSYDALKYPDNFRFAPVSGGEERTSRVSPKAGLIWTPRKNTTMRLAYAQGIGGASIDQSFQIEPSQVAGFNQSFRSIIPESVSAANAGARFEMAALSLEQKFPTETYAGLSLQWLRSKVQRDIGVAALDQSTFPPPPDAAVDSVREHLDYTEKAAVLTLNQLIGANWAAGVRYRIAHAELEDEFPQIRRSTPNNGSSFSSVRSYDAVLHQLMLYAIFNHRSGFFAQGQATWETQQTGGFGHQPDGDAFWQLNAFAGYRWWQRRAEVTVGVLNITDEDYQLDPLTLYNELPRERTFIARLRLNF